MLNELLFVLLLLLLALLERAALFLSGSKSRATFVTLLAETLIPLHWAGRRREGKGRTISNLGQWDWKCVWLLRELEATWGIQRPPPWAVLQIDKKKLSIFDFMRFSFCLYMLLPSASTRLLSTIIYHFFQDCSHKPPARMQLGKRFIFDCLISLLDKSPSSVSPCLLHSLFSM